MLYIYDYVLYNIWDVMGRWDKMDLIIWPTMMEYIGIIMMARVF